MKKLAGIIVERKFVIMLIVILTAVGCAFLIPKVGINTDMTKYLPDDSSMKIGMDLMEREFPDSNEDYTIRVMFNNLPESEKTVMQMRLARIRYVKDVDYEPDSEDYNRGTYTKYILHTDFDYKSKEQLDIGQTLATDFQQFEMQYMDDSGDSPDLPAWVMIFAVILITVILIIMSGSWIEPFLFLFTIGLAVAINLGTNIFLGMISEKTLSVAAILQLALSIDYSIILTNRYRQELANTDDIQEAMKNAVINTFPSISSSSLTTVVGLLALVFMSFKIGFDMGVVLAKGVFLSVVCVLLVLPGLILICTGLIEKTAKRVPHIPTGGLAKFCGKFRIPLTIGFVVLFGAAYLLQQRTAIGYSMAAFDPIQEVFPKDSTVVLLYENKDDDRITALAEELENRDDVKSAINYSNSLAKQYTAAEMLDAIDDLSGMMGSGGSSVITADESVFNMLYYKYHGGETGKITVRDFLHFITDDVLKNETFSSYISEDIADNTKLIEKLSDPDTLKKPMNVAALSDFFGMDAADCKQILLYYNMVNADIETDTMTISEFVSFALDDLAEDPDYADMLGDEIREQLNTLKYFTTQERAEQEYSAEELAGIFGIPEEQTALLLVYYFAGQSDYQPDTMTISELVRFLKNDVAENETLSAKFDRSMFSQLEQVTQLTDRTKITQVMDYAGIAQFLDMDQNTVRLLMRMNGRDLELDTAEMTMADFTGTLAGMLEDPAFNGSFDAADRTKIRSMKQITDLAASGQPLSAAELAGVLQMDQSLTAQLLAGYGAQTGGSMTAAPLTGFIDYLSNYVLTNPQYASFFDRQTAANLRMMQQLCRAASSGQAFTTGEFSQMFGMEESRIRIIFTIFFQTEDRNISPYDFVDFICTDLLRNPFASSRIDNASAQKLTMLKAMMNSALNNTQLRYTDAASLFGIAADKMKLLFALKGSGTTEQKLSLKTLAEFLSENKDELSDAGDPEMLEKAEMLKGIMDAALDNEQLDEAGFAELTEMDEDTAHKLFLLYLLKNEDSSTRMLSPEEFIRFLNHNVLSDETMSAQITEDDRDKLSGAARIIEAVISGREYDSDQMSELFADMSDEMDNSTVSLMYLYYFANLSPDKTQTMSVEQLMSYLRYTLIYDDAFKLTLDDQMIADICDNSVKINSAVKRLKSEDYSRLILIVTVPEEGPETEAFYRTLNRECKYLKGSYHLIGSSAMNYEMSLSFHKELLLITLLTAAAIFLVVLITFRSLTVPVILVLLVQCGVFITVTIIGLQGYSIYYLALLIVQCILMGSTIDYGILFSHYYREARKEKARPEALKQAFAGSINTIMTSGLIIVTATAILGQCYGEPTVEEICKTIAIGAASAIILIVFILPGILACLDTLTGGRNRLKDKETT